MDEQAWEAARLIPVSGINGADEQERRGVSALMAVLESVREFGREITVPLGAPAGAISCFIEVTFNEGDRRLRPDGLIRVVRGSRQWTALVEVKTGRNDLAAPQIENYLDVAREQGFDAVLTISNQIAAAPGDHPVAVDKRKLKKVDLYHLSWSQIHTEAVIARVNKSVADPDQAWILAELIRYLEHPRSGAVDFDDMGPSWVTVRDAAIQRTLRATDKAAADVVSRYGQLVAFAGLRLSRELGVEVRPALSRADMQDRARWLQTEVSRLVEAGTLRGTLRVPQAVAPFTIESDLRANRVTCSVTVDAPNQGRPATRVNWLIRQLRDAPDTLLIEAVANHSRGAGPTHPLAKLRTDPQLLIEDPKRDIKAFRLVLGAPAGTKRGQGRGSFVGSVLELCDRFYTEVVQNVRPWTPSAPRAKAPEAVQPGEASAEISGELSVIDEVAIFPEEPDEDPQLDATEFEGHDSDLDEHVSTESESAQQTDLWPDRYRKSENERPASDPAVVSVPAAGSGFLGSLAEEPAPDLGSSDAPSTSGGY